MSSLRAPAPVAAVTCGVWLVISLALGGYVPFAHFPMFRFPTSEGPTAMPLFLADGEPAAIEDYVDFEGLDPERIDVEHRGYACAAEHMFHEQQAWLSAHGSGSGSGSGSGRVGVAVGLRILAVDPGTGRVTITQRIDMRGTARAR